MSFHKMKTKVFSYAKLNLHLSVSQKIDQLHLLKMSNICINWYDELEFVINQEGTGKISTEFSFYDSHIGNNNLIEKAIKVFLPHLADAYDVHVKIKKNIPPGSGLGGGSSNAAATMTYLNQLWKLFTYEELLQISLRLGSDIPFFLNGLPSHVGGTGGVLSPLSFSTKGYYFLVVIPSFSLSTKDVFQKYDEVSKDKKNKHFTFSNSLFPLTNDLLSAALIIEPSIHDLLRDLKLTHPLDLSMSGSGSACYGVYDSLDSAENAKDLLKNTYPLLKITKAIES